MMIFKKEHLLPAILLESLTHLQKKLGQRSTPVKSILWHTPPATIPVERESVQLLIPYILKISKHVKHTGDEEPASWVGEACIPRHLKHMLVKVSVQIFPPSMGYTKSKNPLNTPLPGKNVPFGTLCNTAPPSRPNSCYCHGTPSRWATECLIRLGQ